MKITPQDIHHKEFKRTMRGYSEEEVDIFLDEIAENFEKLYRQNHTNEEEINRLKERLKTYEKMELTLQNTLLTAQKSAEEVQENAKKEAALVKRSATLEVKRIVGKAEKQKQLYSEAFSKIKSLQSEFKIKVKNNVEKLLSKLNQIDAQEKDLSLQIEKEFENIPEVEVPEIEEELVSRAPKIKEDKAKELAEKEKELLKAGDKKKTREEESKSIKAAPKADASKSDIASEAEIDAFLGKEGQTSKSDEKKKGLLSRLFNKKEISDNELKDEKEEKKVKVKVEAKSEKVKNKKNKKKKKEKKKNTEEITEVG